MPADVIVLATPVYFYCMDAQMKIMIALSLPPPRKTTKKNLFFLVPAADPGHSAADETLSGLRGFLKCLPGAQECGVIYGTGAWDKGDIYRHPALDKAYQAGKNV